MKPEFNLATSVQFLRSVGPARARGLARLGIETVGDLLEHYPRRYFDRTSTTPVGRLRSGTESTILGVVHTVVDRRTRRGGSLQTITIGDDTGVLFCIWFNQRYLTKQFRAGKRVMVSGLVQRHGDRLQMAHPDYEILEEDDGQDGPSLHTGRMVPVYGLTAGIGQHWLRSLVHQALERLPAGKVDPLPAEIRARHGLMGLDQAVRGIHFPEDQGELQEARRRLAYQEGFLVQTLIQRRRAGREARQGIRLHKPGDLTTRMVGDLPFSLTGAQRRVLAEILADLRSGRIMHRLVQGDVGCGKTLVAFIAALFTIEQGYQAMLMAPTEVLARQHGQTLARLAAPLDLQVETLTGSTPAAERRTILSSAANRDIDLLVGTHALLQDDVHLPDLALSIVDEQHRFGVRQRGLKGRGGWPRSRATCWS